MDTQKIEAAVKMIIEAVDKDINREGLQETPARVARMYQEIFSGLGQTAEEHLSKSFEIIDDNMVVSTLTLQPGDRVAFTGTHSGEEAAKFAGLIVGDVTEATVMVVAADPDSTSVKAKKARQYHIPIITKKRFNQLVADLMRTE